MDLVREPATPERLEVGGDTRALILRVFDRLEERVPRDQHARPEEVARTVLPPVVARPERYLASQEADVLLADLVDDLVREPIPDLPERE